MEREEERTDGPCRLWGVYHANGGLIGELAYVAGKLKGTTHCALCDIAHRIRMKDEWKDFVDGLDVPFHLVHLNERPEPIAELAEGSTPCVVEQSPEGFRILLGPEELEEAGGSVVRFAELLGEARG